MEKKIRTKMVEVSEEYFVANDGTEFETAELCMNYESKKDKYAVNVVFEGKLERPIKERAKEIGIGVAPYIKMLVAQDLKNKE